MFLVPRDGLLVAIISSKLMSCLLFMIEPCITLMYLFTGAYANKCLFEAIATDFESVMIYSDYKDCHLYAQCKLLYLCSKDFKIGYLSSSNSKFYDTCIFLKSQVKIFIEFP